MKKYRLLVVGGGILQIPMILTAQKMGVFVISVDYDINAPAKYVADSFELVSTQDLDGCLAIARKYRVDGVVTAGTDVSKTVSYVAEKMSLIGVPMEVAIATTNKYEMRQKLSRAGIEVPNFIQIDSLDLAFDWLKDQPYPLVIKPVDSMGARGVKKIATFEELNNQFDRSMQFSRSKKVILEEYMSGPEVSVDTIVYEGKVHMITIADRIIEGDPYFIEKGHNLPNQLSQDQINDIEEMVRKAIHAMGITLGPSKFDMKITKNGARVGEMTSRLSGGFHSQYTENLSCGKNSMKAVIDIALGKELALEDVEAKWNRSAVERSIIPNPGRIVEISGIDQALKIKGVYKIFQMKKIGDIMEPVISNIGKAAHIITEGANLDDAISAASEAIDRITFKVVA